MMQASLAQAQARRQRYVTPGGALTHVSTYLGTNKMELLAQGKTAEQIRAELADQPMAYLVEQAAGAVVDPHFHEVDQFQLFTQGSGRIGTHRVDGVTVHYAGAYSPYGPIAAGSQGLSYLTLRRQWDSGAQWMPASAQRLRGLIQRRHVSHTSEPLQIPDDCSQGNALVLTEVMAAPPHAGQAHVGRAGPSCALLADARGCAGMFWYVLSGSVIAHVPPGERRLDTIDQRQHEQGVGGCLYFAPAEGPCPMQAGAAGVCFVQLRFPLL